MSIRERMSQQLNEKQRRVDAWESQKLSLSDPVSDLPDVEEWYIDEV